MRLGLFTAAFPGLDLETIAEWAAANGFEALELAVWPREAASRRYAGVATIDVLELSPARAAEIRDTVARRGLRISSLGYYPNPLDPDPAVSGPAIEHLRAVMRAAALLGVPTVGTFVGRDHSRGLEPNLEAFARVWPPLVREARDLGLRIAIENCPMLFSSDEWPGGKNLATSPAIWERMWEIIPDPNFGLNLDPSHLVWQMIDPLRVVRDYAPRIFHVHGKDMLVDREALYRHGILSQGMGWQVPRLPGLGDMDWRTFIAALYRAGYDGVLSVEHEDRNFEGSEERVKRGFLIARDVLRPYLH